MARPFQRKPKPIGVELLDHAIGLALYALLVVVTLALCGAGLGVYALCRLGGFL